MRSKLFLDFSRPDQFELAFDDLTRAIHNAPLFVKPAIANNPFEPVAETVKRSGDGILQLMKLLMSVFEQMRGTAGFIPYPYVAERWPGSRAMMDILIDQAQAQGLIKTYPSTYIDITMKGKMYAIENKLVE